MLYVNGISLRDGAGGIPTHTRSLIAALHRRSSRPDFRVACSDVVATPNLDVWRPGLNRRAWLELTVPYHLRREKPTFWIDTAFNTPVASRKTRTVTWMPDASPFTRWKGKNSRLLEAVIRRSCRRADRLLFTTVAVRDEYVSLGLLAPSDHRVRIVPLGVDVSIARGADHAPQGRPVWLGSMVPRKDIDTMRRASEIAGLAVDYVGPGLPAEIAEHSDLLRRIRTAPCVIVTSRYEGFSLPIAEALAMGTPVVLSDISVHREVARGSSATFFPSGDARALGEILRRKEWAHRTERTPTWHRSWDDVAADLLEVCAEI